MSDKMREGGTGARSGKQRGYELVEHYAKRMPRYADGATVHRGDMVHIVGEDGCAIYKVLAMDDSDDTVQVIDTGRNARWVPARELEHVPLTDKRNRR